MATREHPVIEVEAAERATRELVKAFSTLVPQLSSSSEAPGEAELVEMLEAPSTTVLVARSTGGSGLPEGRIVGTLTLVVFRVPTGVRAWIEDVVVDTRARSKGAGEALVMEAIRRASAAGAGKVDLTSRPTREAANRLYKRVGFEPRATNIYRYTIGD